MDNRRSNRFGFMCLNATQALGAANDNILKQVVVFGVAAGGIWADQLGEGAQAIRSLCLAGPFVLFYGFAGQFSDRDANGDAIESGVPGLRCSGPDMYGDVLLEVANDFHESARQCINRNARILIGTDIAPCW